MLPGSDHITNKFKTVVREARAMVIDLTGLRPSVMREVGVVDENLDPDYVILIAKIGTVPPPDIGSRSIRFYRSTEHLRELLSGDLGAIKAMLDAEDDGDDDQ